MRLGSVSTLLLAAALAACGPRLVDVPGQVFIVTKGGESIRLGLVDIRVTPADSLSIRIETLRRTREAQAGDVIRRYRAAGSVYSAAVSVQNAALVRPDVKACSSPLQWDFGKGKPDPYLLPPCTAEAMRQWSDVERPVASSRTAMLALGDSVRGWLSANYWATELAAGIATKAQTGPDGEFHLKLLSGKKYGILAAAVRSSGRDTEPLNWVVWFTPTGSSTAPLRLTNNNLVDAEDTTNVLRWMIREF